MSSTWKVVNAYLDDGGGTIIVRERNGDEARERRIPAEYVTWHRAEDLGKEAMRQLKSLDTLVGMRVEGDWLRISWDRESGRDAGRRGMRESGIETYEGDVDPVLLWLIESGVEIGRPKRCYLDIEADSRVALSQKEDMRVLSWAVVDHDTGEELLGIIADESDFAEERLLKDLRCVLERYDQICVWEGDWKGGEFDSIVVPARMQRQGIAFDPRRWLWLNQLATWKRMNMQTAESGAEKESFKLEDITHQQLGKGKEPVPDFVRERFGAKCDKGLGAMAWDLWEAGGAFRELLGTYNVRDAVLLRELEQRKGYITLFQAICELCGVVPVTKSLQPTRQMDGYMLRLGRRKNRRFATKKFRERDEASDEEEQFKGAVVFEPATLDPEWRRAHGMKNGILRNVHVCDYSGMYPSMMLTFNLGAEVKVGWAKSVDELKPGECLSPGTGLVTRTDEYGMVTFALRDLIRLRKEFADLAATLPPGTPEWQDANSKSNACKVTANSFYGAGGSPFCRFYDRDVSEATTQNGVHFLKLAAEEATSRGMDLVAGDTDSNMVIGPSMQGFAKYIDWLNKKRFPAEVAKHGCVENHIKIAYEKSFDRIVFVAKKRYIGSFLHYKWSTTCNHCVTKKGNPGSVDVRTLTCRDCGHVYTEIPKFLGKPEIKGLEYKRGDKGKLTREFQARIIDCIVGGVTMKDKLGKDVPVNPEIVTPTEDLEVYYRLIENMQTYVFHGTLPIEEVRFSKALSKSLREYGKDASEAHVRVARTLKERGQAMAKGVRIEFVVVDASTSPQMVIPAEDYAGEFDRFYLWERVFGPSEALLAAAFPDVDWTKWSKTRPPKPRKGKAPENQLGLDLALERSNVVQMPLRKMNPHDELAVPVYRAQPLNIVIPEAAGKEAVDRVAAVMRAHPGARSVRVTIETTAGVRALLPLDIRVSPSPKFKEEIEQAIAGTS